MPLHVVHVAVRVKPDTVEAFRAATLANANESIKEHGCARFDVLQTLDDPTRFLLVEIYRGPDDQAAHRETEHYKTWRDTVADMMAEPRAATKYASLFPTTL